MGRNTQDFSVGVQVANPLLAEGAAQYAQSLGLARPRRSFSDIVVNPEVGRRIASEYEAAPSFDPNAVESFKHFARETSRQFDFLTRPRRRGGLGINVDVTPHDPYSGAGEMVQDLAHNRHLSVLSTASTGSHPLLTNDENDMFRAVHDAFGHAATGRDFGRHGEEAAWMSHIGMYTPPARPAMTTETRGQNSTYVFGSNPGNFPEQKVATLGSGQLVVPMGRRRAAFNAALAAARESHAKSFGG